MVIGNFDRLVQIVEDKQGKFSLANFESNLGNVMVQLSQNSKSDLALFTIDNDLDPSFIDDPKKRRDYSDFLRELFTTPDWQQAVAKKIGESLLQALANSGDDESSMNVAQLKKDLQPFADDIKSKGPAHLASGLAEMATLLQTQLIPTWESQNATSLKQYLTLVNPNMLAAVMERLDVFKSTRK
jgi:hypothetical protein